MNIDIREYLRTNPISSYELTISSNGLDGFLRFYQDGTYEVLTQTQLFSEIYNALFGNLIEYVDGSPVFKYSGDQWNADLTDGIFSEYARASTVRSYMESFNERLS